MLFEWAKKRTTAIQRRVGGSALLDALRVVPASTGAHATPLPSLQVTRSHIHPSGRPAGDEEHLGPTVEVAQRYVAVILDLNKRRLCGVRKTIERLKLSKCASKSATGRPSQKKNVGGLRPLRSQGSGATSTSGVLVATRRHAMSPNPHGVAGVACDSGRSHKTVRPPAPTPASRGRGTTTRWWRAGPPPPPRPEQWRRSFPWKGPMRALPSSRRGGGAECLADATAAVSASAGGSAAVSASAAASASGGAAGGWGRPARGSGGRPDPSGGGSAPSGGGSAPLVGLRERVVDAVVQPMAALGRREGALSRRGRRRRAAAATCRRAGMVAARVGTASSTEGAQPMEENLLGATWAAPAHGFAAAPRGEGQRRSPAPPSPAAQSDLRAAQGASSGGSGFFSPQNDPRRAGGSGMIPCLEGAGGKQRAGLLLMDTRR